MSRDRTEITLSLRRRQDTARRKPTQRKSDGRRARIIARRRPSPVRDAQ